MGLDMKSIVIHKVGSMMCHPVVYGFKGLAPQMDIFRNNWVLVIREWSFY